MKSERGRAVPARDVVRNDDERSNPQKPLRTMPKRNLIDDLQGSRRNFLIGGAVAVAAGVLPTVATAGENKHGSSSGSNGKKGEQRMNTITTKDGTQIIHGDDDQIVPIADSAMLSSKIVKGAKLKIYKGAPHGLCTTHKNLVNEDLLAFIKE